MDPTLELAIRRLLNLDDEISIQPVADEEDRFELADVHSDLVILREDGNLFRIYPNIHPDVKIAM